MRTIRVTGKGKLSLKPDTIRLSLELEDLLDTYGEAFQESSVQTNILKNEFAALGFEKSDLKTTSFGVDAKYESYRDKNNDYQTKFVGYEFTHRLKLEFPVDNNLLGKILYRMSKWCVETVVHFTYTVKDTERAKNELLAKAIEDSKMKAQVLSKAAGVELGDIETIDYSWGETDMFVEPMRKLTLMEKCCDEPSSINMDIEPENIDISDIVTVVWSIK